MGKSKRYFNVAGMIFLSVLFLVGCGSNNGSLEQGSMEEQGTAQTTPSVLKEYKEGMYGEKEEKLRFTDYYELSDGTWRAKSQSSDKYYDYKYRLEIQGILFKSAREAVHVVLSNKKDITLDDIYKNTYSSYDGDLFQENETMEVEINYFMDYPEIVEHHQMEDAFSDQGHAPIMNYYKMKDNTWRTDTDFYKYCIKKTGKAEENKGTEEFVVLSNTKNVTMKDIRNYLQGGESGILSDKSEAVLVDRETADAKK